MAAAISGKDWVFYIQVAKCNLLVVDGVICSSGPLSSYCNAIHVVEFPLVCTELTSIRGRDGTF